MTALATHPRFRHLFSFIEKGGWYSAHAFVAWLKEKLDSGTYHGEPRQFSDMSLAQFHDASGTHLTLIAADTTDGRLLVLNHHTAPNCPLVWAVRMSMSIPLLWQEVQWQAEWGMYRGKEIPGNRIVDGGLLSNFPLELLVSDEPQVIAVMGPKETSNVLGLLIDETLPVEGADEETPEDDGIRLAELRTVKRLRRLVNTVTQAHDKMVMEAFAHLVVRLPAKGYGTTEFDMGPARRAGLIAAGRRAVQQYFEGRAIPLREGVARAPLRDLEASRRADRIALRILGQ